MSTRPLFILSIALFFQAQAADYFPLSINNSWRYQDDYVTKFDTSTSTVIGDTTVNMVEFFIVQFVSPTIDQISYRYEENGIVWATLSLNDLSFKNFTAKHAYSDGETFTIQEGETATVTYIGTHTTASGTSFDSCFSVFYCPDPSEAYYYINVYAPNVGIIENNYKYATSTDTTLFSTIIDYTIQQTSINFSLSPALQANNLFTIQNTGDFFVVHILSRKVPALTLYAISGRKVCDLPCTSDGYILITKSVLCSGTYFLPIADTNQKDVFRFSIVK
jgi:hypothetical protein